MSLALTLVAALLVATAAGGAVWRARDGRRRRTGTLVVPEEELGVRADRAVLLQFTTETCARCAQVRRLLREIAGELPGVEFAEIDLTHRPETAARHRILSTPTTFVVLPDGSVAARFAGVPRRHDVVAAVDGIPQILEAR